jgi:hypothetical protein
VDSFHMLNSAIPFIGLVPLIKFGLPTLTRWPSWFKPCILKFWFFYLFKIKFFYILIFFNILILILIYFQIQ